MVEVRDCPAELTMFVTAGIMVVSINYRHDPTWILQSTYFQVLFYRRQLINYSYSRSFDSRSFKPCGRWSVTAAAATLGLAAC